MAARLLDAVEILDGVLQHIPAGVPVQVVAPDADLALYCDVGLLAAALQDLIAANLSTAGAVVEVDAVAQFVRFRVRGRTVPESILPGAARLLGRVEVEAFSVSLLVPSADWSPSHRH